MASDLPFYDIFAPQKITFSKISDDVIACDLWFGPPQSKILATPMAITELEKLNSTPQTKSMSAGINSYLNSFECIVMSSMWLKILAAFDLRN